MEGYTEYRLPDDLTAIGGRVIDVQVPGGGPAARVVGWVAHLAVCAWSLHAMVASGEPIVYLLGGFALGFALLSLGVYWPGTAPLGMLAFVVGLALGVVAAPMTTVLQATAILVGWGLLRGIAWLRLRATLARWQREAGMSRWTPPRERAEATVYDDGRETTPPAGIVALAGAAVADGDGGYWHAEARSVAVLGLLGRRVRIHLWPLDPDTGQPPKPPPRED